MDLEVVCTEINTGTHTFLILCLYRPTNAKVSSRDKMDSLIDKCSNTWSNIIIVSDFNEDISAITPLYELLPNINLEILHMNLQESSLPHRRY